MHLSFKRIQFSSLKEDFGLLSATLYAVHTWRKCEAIEEMQRNIDQMLLVLF